MMSLPDSGASRNTDIHRASKMLLQNDEILRSDTVSQRMGAVQGGSGVLVWPAWTSKRQPVES